MIQVVLLVFIGLISVQFHPFHLSICEIEHDADSKSLQITSRLFQDDFEVALGKIAQSHDYFNKTSTVDAEIELQKFFDKHLRITLGSKPLTHELLGYEIEDNVVWCYLEIKEVNEIREISVQYSALIDTFNDQINLAHIRYQGKVKSLKFQKNQLSGNAAFTN